MSYIKEKDLIYKDLAACYDEYYLEDLIFFVEDAYENLPLSEVIHQRLTHTLYHSTAAFPSATDVLLLLLLHRDCITAEQMVRLGLFGSVQSALNTISRLKKRQASGKKAGKQETENQAAGKKAGKKAGAINASTSTSGTAVYSLSGTQRQEFILNELPTGDYINKFPLEYIKDNGIRENGEVSDSVRDHDLELLYLFYDLVRDETLMDFQWLPSCVLGPCSSFDALRSQVHNFTHSFSRTDYPDKAVSPDAVILPWDESFRHLYFVEQDMVTENIGKLTEKMSKYNTLLVPQGSDDLASLSIILPTFIKRSGLDDAETERMKLSNQIKRMAAELESAMQSFGVSTFRELEKHIVTDVKKRKGVSEDEAEKEKGRASGSSAYNNLRILKFLEKVSQFDRTVNSVPELKRFTEAMEERDRKRTSNRADEKAAVIMKRRMAQFKNAIEESGLKSKCASGLSVFAYDNRSDAVPYIFLHDSGLMKDLTDLCRMSFYELGTSRNASVLPYDVFTFNGESYTLRNVIRFKDSKVPTAVEVVAYDIGAMYRIDRVLSLMDTGFPCNLCLVVSSIEEAEAINRDFMIRDCYFTESDARKKKGVMSVAFCLAESSLSGKRLFNFDSAGKVIYR